MSRRTSALQAADGRGSSHLQPRRRHSRVKGVAGQDRTTRTETFWDHNDQGVQFYRQRAYNLALAAFERAVRTSPLPLATLEINLGAACLRREMYPEARSWLEKGVARDPDNQRAHWLLAQTLMAMGEFFAEPAIAPPAPRPRRPGDAPDPTRDSREHSSPQPSDRL